MFDPKAYQDWLRVQADDKLLELYRAAEKLQPEAKRAVESALNRRGLLEIARNEQQMEQMLHSLSEELAERREQDRARLYAQINRRNEISIDMEDLHRLTFEHLLEEAHIPFHVEDVNFDVAFDLRHRVHYFFRDKDWPAAQDIFQKVQDEASPTQAGKSTFIYYFIALAVLITLVMILIALF